MSLLEVYLGSLARRWVVDLLAVVVCAACLRSYWGIEEEGFFIRCRLRQKPVRRVRVPVSMLTADRIATKLVVASWYDTSKASKTQGNAVVLYTGG